MVGPGRPAVCTGLRGLAYFRVRVRGARGTAAPSDYKVSATHSDGWRLLGTLMIGGGAS